jgi:hypothetical protein
MDAAVKATTETATARSAGITPPVEGITAGTGKGGKVLDYIPNALNYLKDDGIYAGSTDPNMKAISAQYTSEFTTPVVGNSYNPGTYTLQESYEPGDPATSSYTVWQYYMFDKEGTRVPPDPIHNSFTEQTFGTVSNGTYTPAAKLVWRLVTIAANKPTFADITPIQSKRHPMSRVLLSQEKP